jgi:hypothetical protein
MKVAFRKEINLDINMSGLVDECIDRLDWQQKRAAQGRYSPDYEDLFSLVQESLEFMYDIDAYEYDNGSEQIIVITKNLLLWCLENDYIEEHDRLEEMY